MKYNTTYSSVTTLTETIDFYESVRQTFISFFTQKYNLKRIVAPAFFLVDDPLNLELNERTRGITFDTANNYQVARLPLSHTAFLRNFMLTHPKSNASGYYLEASYIWRDLPETPTASAAHHELVAIVKQTQKTESFLDDLTLAAFDIILDLAQKAVALHKIKHSYPWQIPFKSAQTLEYEYSTKSFQEREVAAAQAHHAYVLQNPGLTLVTGHVHSQIPLSLYLANAFNQIILFDQVNAFALKVVTVSQIATGKKLWDQLGDQVAKRQEREYQKAIDTEEVFYEIKINLPRLVMALLKKGHIAEVQPDVYTEEQKVVKSRYKVDAF